MPPKPSRPLAWVPGSPPLAFRVYIFCLPLLSTSTSKMLSSSSSSSSSLVKRVASVTDLPSSPSLKKMKIEDEQEEEEEASSLTPAQHFERAVVKGLPALSHAYTQGLFFNFHPRIDDWKHVLDTNDEEIISFVWDRFVYNEKGLTDVVSYAIENCNCEIAYFFCIKVIRFMEMNNYPYSPDASKSILRSAMKRGNVILLNFVLNSFRCISYFDIIRERNRVVNNYTAVNQFLMSYI